MKHTTKRYLAIAAASALVIGAATTVFGHEGNGSGYGPGWGGNHGMMGPGGMHGPGQGWMMGGPGGMQGPGGMMGGPGGMRGPGVGAMMGGDPVAFADQQLTETKSVLGITPDQEGAWNAYEEAVKGKAALMLTHRQTMFGDNPVTTEQRFDFREQGLEQMQLLTAASRDLYNSLTPEQQAQAGYLVGFQHARR